MKPSIRRARREIAEMVHHAEAKALTHAHAVAYGDTLRSISAPAGRFEDISAPA